MFVTKFILIHACATSYASTAKQHTTQPPKQTSVYPFATLKSAPTNVRTGPGKQYPIRWVFMQPKMPVKIIATFEHWRKIQDTEGDQGWIHNSLLSHQRTAIVWRDHQYLKQKPDINAKSLAKFEKGAIVYFLKQSNKWCNVLTEGSIQMKGWIPCNALWGAH